MIILKKLVLLQNVALAISFIALICSIFSLIFVVRYGFNEKYEKQEIVESKKDTKPSDKKIIKVNNFTVKTDIADKQHDDNREMSLLKSQEKDKNKQNEGKKNGVNAIAKGNKAASSNNQSNERKIVEKKETKKEKKTNNNFARELSNNDVRNVKNSKVISAENNIQSESIKNDDDRSKTDSKINGTNSLALLNNTFVVQVGAFNKKQMAEQQCQIVKAIIKNKNCEVRTSDNSMFRSVVFAFTSLQEAQDAAKQLSDKLKMKCIPKKSI